MRKGKPLNSNDVAKLEQAILERLDKGISIARTCLDVGVSRPWFYKRKEVNQVFKDKVDQILSKDPAEYDNTKLIKRHDWMDKFIEEFAKNGGQQGSAATAVGKDLREVMAYLNPLHPLYDQNFKDELEQAEIVVTQVMLDEARRRGMDKSNTMLVQCLQWLDPDRFVIDKKGGPTDLPFQVNISLNAETRAKDLLNSMVIDGEYTAADTRELGGDSKRKALPSPKS